jgi:hypothetical protein
MKRVALPIILMAGALVFSACEGNGPTEVDVANTEAANAHVTPELVPGAANKTCFDLLGAGYLEYKIDPPANGVYNLGGGLQITISNLTNNKTFNWSSNFLVSAVFVKAGAGGSYLYDYRPDGSMGDTGLTSPGAGTTNQISHISFCFQPRLTITKTATTTYDREWTWTIEKDQDYTLPLDFSEGDLLSVDYTVTLSATSEDVDHNVSGTITIHNPAVWGMAANITSVTDVLTPGDIAATVNCPGGLPQALASGGTLVCTYSKDVDDDATTLNTATVVSTGVLGGTATAPITWGDPDDIIDECVDVDDLLEINGAPAADDDLGTVCAPDDLTGGQKVFEYTRTFGAGGDFSLVCGQNNDIDNTASFLTNDTGDTGSDSEEIDLFVICEEPGDSETAWAADGLNTPGTRPYNEGSGNWATYVAYFGEEKTVTMYAGQTQDVGTVTFSAPSGGMVRITINLTGGWEFEAGSIVAVQDYNSAPSGNPSPGLFDHKKPASGISVFIDVPQNNFYGVHAVVVQ